MTENENSRLNTSSASHRFRWRVLRICFLLAAAFALSAPLSQWVFGWRATLLDMGHFPLFFCVAWAVRGRLLSSLAAAAVAAVSACVVEVAQLFLGRSTALGDAANGIAGALAAGICMRLKSGASLRFPMLWLALLVAVPFANAAPALLRNYHSYSEFPRLTNAAAGRWDEWSPHQSELALDPTADLPIKIVFLPGSTPYSGVLFQPDVNNWTCHRWFVAEIECSETALLNFTFRDMRKAPSVTQRYNYVRRLHPGRQTVRIALDQISRQGSPPVDIAQIRSIDIWMSSPSEPLQIQLSDFRLEPLK